LPGVQNGLTSTDLCGYPCSPTRWPQTACTVRASPAT